MSQATNEMLRLQFIMICVLVISQIHKPAKARVSNQSYSELLLFKPTVLKICGNAGKSEQCEHACHLSQIAVMMKTTLVILSSQI